MNRDKSSAKDKALEMRRAAQILLDRAVELEALADSPGPHSVRNVVTLDPVETAHRYWDCPRELARIDTKKFSTIPSDRSAVYQRPPRDKTRRAER